MSSKADQDRWRWQKAVGQLSHDQARIELLAHDRCPELVYSSDVWSPSKLCARPIKGEGLCGIHLGAKKRAVAVEVRKATSAQVDERLSAAVSRILDHPVHMSRMFGGYPYFVVEDVTSLLVEFGVEPLHPDEEFQHKKNCPKNVIGPTHIGETCREYIRRAGTAGPDVSDLEEDQ